MKIQLANLMSQKLFAATNPTMPVTNCNKPTCDTHLPQVTAGADSVHIILQLAFGIIGAVSLIVIIIAGLQLVTSQGDPQSTAKARQTIIYAVVGLVVALSAEVIVTFVLGRL